MLRQQQKLPVPKIPTQPRQHIPQKRRQLRRVVRHVRVQPRRSAPRRQYRHQSAIGRGVEAVFVHDGGEQGGGCQGRETGDAVGAEGLRELRDGGLGF